MKPYALRGRQARLSADQPVKMYGCAQTIYPRKNWSSMMLMDCAKLRLWTKQAVETQTGAYLHRFQDIPDEQIGEIAQDLEHARLDGRHDQADPLHERRTVVPAISRTIRTPAFGIKCATKWNGPIGQPSGCRTWLAVHLRRCRNLSGADDGWPAMARITTQRYCSASLLHSLRSSAAIRRIAERLRSDAASVPLGRAWVGVDTLRALESLRR